jgi:hypothetical protein
MAKRQGECLVTKLLRDAVQVVPRILRSKIQILCLPPPITLQLLWRIALTLAKLIRMYHTVHWFANVPSQPATLEAKVHSLLRFQSRNLRHHCSSLK